MHAVAVVEVRTCVGKECVLSMYNAESREIRLVPSPKVAEVSVLWDTNIVMGTRKVKPPALAG